MRISGEDSFEIASRIVSRPITAKDAGRFFHAKFTDPSGASIDDGLALVFKAPRSYTGEDAVELQCHGGTASPRRVLEAVLSAGARLARRGEFTLRAFLNGRLSLDAAEAVIDLIDAKTDRAAQSAHERIDGRSRREISAMYSKAVEISSRVENALDFSEDELPEGFLDEARHDAEMLLKEMRRSCSELREGEILRRGALVVLSGPPNSGKSSLMNAILGESRAIVSAIAGTTRDSIEESIDIEGWPVRLADTAGIRETTDEIEAEGVRRSESLARKADIVLRLDDSWKAEAGIPARGFKRGMRVFTKADLHSGEDAPVGSVKVSALTGEGIGALRRAIASMLDEMAAEGLEENGADVPTREREAIAASARAVEEAIGNLSSGDAVLAANSLQRAAAALGGYLGKIWREDILTAIFDRFCVGK